MTIQVRAPAAIARLACKVRPLVTGLGLRAFFGNAALLSVGTILAQLVAVAVSPVLTRIYSTEAFGIFSVFTAIAGILAPIACLRLDFALPLPFARRMAAAMAQLACLSTLAFSPPLALAGIAISNGWFGRLFGTTDAYLYLLWFALPPVALQLILVGWNIRRKEFRALTYSRVATAIGGVVFQIVGGLVSNGPAGLILGMAAGQWLGCIMQGGSLVREFRQVGLLPFRLMRRTALTYRKFLMWNLPSSVVNALGDQAIPIVVVGLFGAQAGGLFFLASRAASLPLNLVSTSLSRVMWSEVSRMQRERPERLRNLFLAIAFGSFVLTAPGLVLFPFGPQTFAFVFGEQWRTAGLLAAIIYCGAWFGVPANTTSSLSLLGYNHLQSAWEVGRLSVMILIAAVAWFWKLTLVEFTIALSVGMAFSYFGLSLMNFYVITHVSRGALRQGQIDLS